MIPYSRQSINDDDMDQLQLTISAAESEPNISLILSETMTIILQRCAISFQEVNLNPTYQDKSITFSYNLSSNCLVRDETNFMVNINAFELGINHQLIISIKNSASFTTLSQRESNERLAWQPDFPLII